LTAIVIKQNERSLCEVVGNRDCNAASHVVIAGSCVPEYLSAVPKVPLPGRPLLRQNHEALQHACYEWGGKAKISPSALSFKREQPGVVEFREVTARCLRGDAGHVSKFRRGQRSTVHQYAKHIRARRITDESCDLSDFRTSIHRPFLHRSRRDGNHEYFGEDSSDCA